MVSNASNVGRVTVGSALCGMWIHSRCTGVMRMVQKISRHLKCEELFICVKFRECSKFFHMKNGLTKLKPNQPLFSSL